MGRLEFDKGYTRTRSVFFGLFKEEKTQGPRVIYRDSGGNIRKALELRLPFLGGGSSTDSQSKKRLPPSKG